MLTERTLFTETARTPETSTPSPVWRSGDRVEFTADGIPGTVVEVWENTPETPTVAGRVGFVEVEVDGLPYHVISEPTELRRETVEPEPADGADTETLRVADALRRAFERYHAGAKPETPDNC